jgi:hypothetical protein
MDSNGIPPKINGLVVHFTQFSMNYMLIIDLFVLVDANIPFIKLQSSLIDQAKAVYNL